MTLGKITTLWIITILIGSLIISIPAQIMVFETDDIIPLFGIFLAASTVCSIPAFIIVSLVHVNIQELKSPKYSPKKNYLLLNLAVSLATILVGEMMTKFTGAAAIVIGTYMLIGLGVWIGHFHLKSKISEENNLEDTILD